MAKRLQVALLIETFERLRARIAARNSCLFARESAVVGLFARARARGAPPDWLEAWRGDGIIARIENLAIANAVRRQRLPTVDVSAWRFLPKLPCVETDNEAIAQLAFDHLRNCGFKNMAFCGDERFQWSRERREAFGRLAVEAGFRIDIYPPAHDGRIGLLLGKKKKNNWRPGFGSWPSRAVRWPATIFEAGSCWKCAAARAWPCRTKWPWSGVDNDDLLCNLSEPPLSSVIPDADRAGYQAATLLDRMMLTGQMADGLHLLKPTGMVIRQSSDVLAITDPNVSLAVRFIRDHAAEGIKVGDLLRAVPVSRRILEARFKKLLGHSPHDEILRVQLQRVKQLLEETDLPLKAIADRAGFKHVEYLSAVFKRQIGQPPGEYRANHRLRAANAVD